MRPRVLGFRCRILDNGLFILNLSGSCGSVMTHLSPTGEWFTHSSLLSHSNSLRETWEGARYISLLKMATMFIIYATFPIWDCSRISFTFRIVILDNLSCILVMEDYSIITQSLLSLLGFYFSRRLVISINVIQCILLMYSINIFVINVLCICIVINVFTLLFTNNQRLIFTNE